jgi:hypothetical protein
LHALRRSSNRIESNSDNKLTIIFICVFQF